jgi:nucleoid-associated protein YgaU
MQRLLSQLQLDQSYLSLVLGLIIVIIAGFLVFNYFNNKPSLGPAQQSEEQAQMDVEPENLPGKYTVKEGDTLFDIAQKYYNDGYKFTEISKANNIDNENSIVAGQVLEIPKLEDDIAKITPTETVTPTPTETEVLATGGAENQTIWGEKISSDKYTVVAGDWLSKIAGRAYGDMLAYNRIAEANNIANPDLIEPGTVLNIPR